MKFVKRKEVDNKIVKEIAEQLGLFPEIAALLVMRGADSVEKAWEFLNPDINSLSSPDELSGITKASDIIKEKIKQNQTIVIYGDYDCDGIGAVAILYLTLKHLNASVKFYVPQRHSEGYGLNKQAIETIYKEHQPKLIITVDCGIASVDEVDFAKSLGMEVIITDHHESDGELPDAVILNPLLDGCSTPYCGAGVALKLVEKLAGREFAVGLLDICAISTVADVVPLIKDNRVIVKYGLEMLSKGQCRLGLRKLMEKAGIKRGERITSADIAYKIAPRLNAAGRLDSASKSVRLLIEEDMTAINLLAEELDMQNKERQDILNEVYEDALEQLKSYDLSRNLIIILKSENWEEGVVGIAASKIVEEFGRPSILFTEKEGILKGSARSVDGVNIYEILCQTKELLIKYGGHCMAAGMSLKKENFDKFLCLTNKYIQENASKECFEKKIVYDLQIDLSQVKKDFIDSVLSLEPFGCHNPRPVFISKTADMNFQPINSHPHIKAKGGRLSLFGFNLRFALPILNSPAEKYLCYTVNKVINKNSESLKAYIKDFHIRQAYIDKEYLFARYLEKFILKGAKKPALKRSPKEKFNFGLIYVAFTNRAFNDFINEHSDIETLFFNSVVKNPYNSIILSPDTDFDFTYYNKIVFLERPPIGYVELIRQNFFGDIEMAKDRPSFQIEYSYSEKKLREDYIFISNSLKGLSFTNLKSLYEHASVLGYKGGLAAFCISFYIFYQLELIIINNNGTIDVYNFKTDLKKSEINNLVLAGEIC
ncbi:MAG: single-stranded-DNA-specific exonuclease RecJ [Clostridia bacterium]